VQEWSVQLRCRPEYPAVWNHEPESPGVLECLLVCAWRHDGVRTTGPFQREGALSLYSREYRLRWATQRRMVRRGSTHKIGGI
jgi:hypothetical protein